MKLQQPPLDNESVHVNKHLDNITAPWCSRSSHAFVRATIALVSASRRMVRSMIADRDERNQQGTREVLAVEKSRRH